MPAADGLRALAERGQRLRRHHAIPLRWAELALLTGLDHLLAVAELEVAVPGQLLLGDLEHVIDDLRAGRARVGLVTPEQRDRQDEPLHGLILLRTDVAVDEQL